MALTDERQSEIASRVRALTAFRGDLRGGGLDALERARGVQTRALRRGRQYAVTAGTGPDGGEARALERLVTEGAVTRQEASDYLASRYPAQRFAGRQFGGQAQRAIDAALAERAARLRGGRAVVRGGLAASRATAPAPGGSQPFHVEQLPERYDAEAVRRVIARVAEQAAQNDALARARPAAPEPHTLDGAALAPGTVPATALDLKDVGRALLALPGPEEALELELVHSATMDRFVRRASNGESGPGRIWTAADTKPRSSSRIGVGPARYRLVGPGQRFGVMSCRLPPTANLLADSTPGIQFQYGIVVAQIPHTLGRPPCRILSAEAVGDAPVSFRENFQAGGAAVIWPSTGTQRDFYWQRTTAEHLTATFPFMAAFGADANLAASTALIRDCFGLSFQLVTGRNAGEVFRQLCSRTTLGRLLRNNGVGPFVTLPAGQPVNAPCPPNAVTWNAVGPEYTHRTETFDLTSGVILAQGLPFSYADCASLVPTDAHFSVVVQVIGEKVLSQSGLASLASPEAWHQNGLRTVESVTGSLRTWAVDIIVD